MLSLELQHEDACTLLGALALLLPSIPPGDAFVCLLRIQAQLAALSDPDNELIKRDVARVVALEHDYRAARAFGVR